MTTQSMVMALQRLSGREMLINTETADEFLANISRFATTEQSEVMGHEVASRESLCMAYGFEDDVSTDTRKPFVYNDGMAVIPIHGSLINRFGGSWGFVTGYNFIRRQLNLALADEDVDMIIYDVNSPGGEASGCFELAREMMLARTIKPSLAFVDSLAASGGMALAGSATKMYAIPSGRVGSIGVYRQHVSVKGQLDKDGIKVTFASAGDHKLDGSPYEDLPASVLKDWTQDANRTWDDFIAIVAEGRSMDPAAVRDTQARIYRADEALALGLIDGVWSTTEAIAAFVAELDDDNPPGDEEDDDMTTKTEATSTAPVDYDKIAAMIGTAVGGAISNLTRSQNIAAHGKDKGQVALASKLAANPAVSEADAISMIDDASAAAMPKPKGKGKGGKVEAENDDGDGEGEGDDDGEGDDEGEGDDDEDGEEQARAARRSNKVKGGRGRSHVDKVNHLDGAMGRSGGGTNIGGGSGKETEKLTGDAAATATLLGDYAQHTGTVLGKKQAA